MTRPLHIIVKPQSGTDYEESDDSGSSANHFESKHFFKPANKQHNILDDQCTQRTPQCSSNSEYRKIDGSCNHPDHWLGMARTPLRRILQPAYADGKHKFLTDLKNLNYLINIITKLKLDFISKINKSI